VPIPVPDALAAQEDIAAERAELARSGLGRYLAASLLAGAYVGVAVVVLLLVSAPLVVEANPFTRLVQGSVFGLALVLVVFAGAELFTGNTMVMLQGLLRRRVDVVDVVLVWAASLAGNVVGGLGLAALVDATGLLTAGGSPGSLTEAQAALGSLALGSSSLAGGQLFLRAVLCNALACLALWMAARATGDVSRLAVLWWAVLAFVALGFEHSVANVTTLSLAALSGVGEWGDLGRNLVYTVPGNIVGGGLLVGAVYGWLGRPAAAPSTVAPDTTDELVEELVVVAPVLEPVGPTQVAAGVRRPRERKVTKTTARKTTARKTTARKTTARKTPAKRAPAKRAPAKRTARKATAKRAPAKRAATRRPAAKRTTAKRTPAKRRTTTRRTR
jgi:nitrite transporter NirC